MGTSGEPRTFVAIDVETANSFRGSICEIGLVRFSDTGFVDEFTSLVRPRTEFNRFEFTRIHGISASDVASAPTIDEIWPALWEFIGDAPLVAHNASFDMGALFDASGFLGLPIPPTQYFCTVVMARRILSLPSNRLANVAEHFGVPQYAAHRAGDDARVAGEVALHLLSTAGLEWFDALPDALHIAPGHLSTDRNIGTKRITEFSDHSTSLRRQSPRY